MKNWEEILKKELAKKRLQELNPCMFNSDKNCWEFRDYICDDGNSYYYAVDALRAEIEWLGQEAEDNE